MTGTVTTDAPVLDITFTVAADQEVDLFGSIDNVQFVVSMITTAVG